MHKRIDRILLTSKICGNLRIDTHEKNIPMQGCLAKNGFARCGIIYLEDGDPRIAYQKVIKNG